jgi:hypothetical protein
VIVFIEQTANHQGEKGEQGKARTINQVDGDLADPKVIKEFCRNGDTNHLKDIEPDEHQGDATEATGVHMQEMVKEKALFSQGLWEN